MFLLWISPCAGPHDSFSTGILKGSKLSPPPCLFSSFSLSLFPWAQTPTAGLFQPAVLVSSSGTKQTTEGRNEAYVESPQPKGWCVWTILTLSLLPPLVVRGRDETKRLPRCCYWVLVGGSMGDTLREVNTPPEWRGSIKVGGPVYLWGALLSLMRGKKSGGGETCTCSHSSSSTHLSSVPLLLCNIPTLPHSSLSHSDTLFAS